MKRRNERGSVLTGALVILILVVGMGVALATASLHFNKASGRSNEYVEALYAAQGLLEQMKMEVNQSAYDISGNVWLNLNANARPAGGSVDPDENTQIAQGFGEVPIGRSLCNGYVYRMDDRNSLYVIVARAEMSGQQVTLGQQVRARDTFSRYMFYSGRDDLNFGTTTIHGDVHTNRRINFYYGGAKFYDNVSATNGFKYRSGAKESNTQFFKTADPKADEVQMPATAQIEALRNEAQGFYDVHGANGSYGGGGTLDAEIVLLGDKVEITAWNKNTKVKSGVYPMPENGLIYVQGDVRSVSGTCSVPLTIATPNQIDIAGSITYTDGDGDPAYLLYKDGVPVEGNNTPGNVAWVEEQGYTYAINPEYNPDPTADMPVVGLMAGDEIEISNKAPYNMELHASIMSVNDRWSCNLNSQKGNLRVVGSLASLRSGWRSQGAQGYAKSGEYIYDENLMDNPPPFWLPVDRSVWGPRWEISTRRVH